MSYKSTICFSVVLFFFLCCSSGAADVDDHYHHLKVVSKDLEQHVYKQPQAPAAFNHYIFVVRWSVSFCNVDNPTHCETQPEPKFSIHGLWPSVSDGEAPRDCDPSSEFSYRQVRDLQPKLSNYWPDLYNLDPKKNILWKKQWQMHGTCSGHTMKDYFKMALKLFHKIKPYQTLDGMGFYQGHSYKPMDILNLWYATKGLYPMIFCNYDYQNTEQIYELRFNITLDGTDVQPLFATTIGCSSGGNREVEFPVWNLRYTV